MAGARRRAARWQLADHPLDQPEAPDRANRIGARPQRRRPGAGQTSLLRDGACITQFAIPDADRAGQIGAMPLPDGLPEGTVLLQRLSRWLLRPGADHLQAEVESRIAGLGLPLRNPIGNGAASAEKGADRVRRKA